MELLIGLLLVCGAWAVVAAVRVAAELRRRGFEVHLPLLRLWILRYIGQYRRVTREETGRVGPLFYHYVVPLILALVLLVAITVRAWA